GQATAELPRSVMNFRLLMASSPARNLAQAEAITFEGRAVCASQQILAANVSNGSKAPEAIKTNRRHVSGLPRKRTNSIRLGARDRTETVADESSATPTADSGGPEKRIYGRRRVTKTLALDVPWILQQRADQVIGRDAAISSAANGYDLGPQE